MKIITSIVCMFCIVSFLGSQLSSQTKPKFASPILLTSAGQSADVTLAGMLCKKVSIQAKSVPMAKIADLDGIKTVVLVAGFSSKGLGADGISREQEIARIKDLITAAKEKKIPIVMMHIGGKPRRGSQSDEFNKIAAEAANYMLVVKQGDEDHFFSTIATKGKVPIDLIDKIAEATKPLGEIFK